MKISFCDYAIWSFNLWFYASCIWFWYFMICYTGIAICDLPFLKWLCNNKVDIRFFFSFFNFLNHFLILLTIDLLLRDSNSCHRTLWYWKFPYDNLFKQFAIRLYDFTMCYIIVWSQLLHSLMMWLSYLNSLLVVWFYVLTICYNITFCESICCINQVMKCYYHAE